MGNLRFLFSGVLFVAGRAFGGFPAAINGGSAEMTSGNLVMNVTLGSFSGISTGSEFKNWVGYFYGSNAAFESFLDSAHPLAVHPEPAGAASSKLIASSDRTLRLSWSNGANPLPVEYRIYLDGKLVDTTSEQFFVLQGLEYLRDYTWHIEAFDTYGRATMSGTYTFSIAPQVDRLYCAPNPFKPDSEPTTFIFNMNGPGSAKFSIYALPAFNEVFSTTIDDLQGGINTFVFKGRDGDEHPLYNGVYLSVLEKRGNNHETEKFKFAVVR